MSLTLNEKNFLINLIITAFREFHNLNVVVITDDDEINFAIHVSPDHSHDSCENLKEYLPDYGISQLENGNWTYCYGDFCDEKTHKSAATNALHSDIIESKETYNSNIDALNGLLTNIFFVKVRSFLNEKTFSNN